MWLALFLFSADANALCGGPLDNNNFERPVDYTNPEDIEEIENVEYFHFNEEVERLIKGQTGDLPGDLDYVLMHIPNHHRALHAMAKWEVRQKVLKRSPPVGIHYLPTECYFKRAIAFKPNDPVIYLVQGVYLHKSGDFNAAMAAYKKAQELAPDSSETYYNLGLLHFDLEQYDQAVQYAKTAYDMGYPLRGLKKKLQRVGRSVE